MRSRVLKETWDKRSQKMDLQFKGLLLKPAGFGIYLTTRTCYSMTSMTVFNLLEMHAYLSTLQVLCLIYNKYVYYSDSGDNWFCRRKVDSKVTEAAGAGISKMPFWTTAIINLLLSLPLLHTHFHFFHL